jgi:trigger factor
MQHTKQQISPTKLKLTIKVGSEEIETVKAQIVKQLGVNVKVAGFRPGKAPVNVIEKNLDQNVLQSEVINEAVGRSYEQAIVEGKIRAVGQPQITVTKFVPYTELEFTAETDAIGEVKLGNYKKLGIKQDAVTVTAAEITRVIGDLASRTSTRNEVKRAVKDGDEVNLNFKGVDFKTKKVIEGAVADNYDLMIGSKSFIPGFEEEVIGLKAGQAKDFNITFPKDYGVEDLKNKKVTFSIKVNKVSSVDKPKIDDEFAKASGPFKSLAELKSDIKKQLEAEKLQQSQEQFDNKLLNKVAELSDADIPDALIEEEVNRLEEDEKRNLVYRGQTWEEHLTAEGLNDEQHREKQKPLATNRVKTGLMLGIIADKENVTVSSGELETRINLLKTQYASDPSMQAELEKEENKRDIRSRMMIEKTIDKIRSYNQPTTKA